VTINDFMYFYTKLNNYKLSQQQVNSGDSDITYYGFIDRKGNWYIMKQDRSVSGTAEIAYTFIKGSSLYSTNWTNRESLTYATFDSTFA
jgi:hypothetical protein